MSDPNVNPYFDKPVAEHSLTVLGDSGMQAWMPPAAFVAGIGIFAIVVFGALRHGGEATPVQGQQHAATAPQVQQQPASIPQSQNVPLSQQQGQQSPGQPRASQTRPETTGEQTKQ
jgi:hypothetical protein